MPAEPLRLSGGHCQLPSQLSLISGWGSDQWCEEALWCHFQNLLSSRWGTLDAFPLLPGGVEQGGACDDLMGAHC